MEFNKSRHIATAQTSVGEVFNQCQAGIEGVFHDLSANRVTNFVMPLACSFIQVVTTRNRPPFGPESGARMR